MPSWRIVCEGWMNVRPTYWFLTRPVAVRDAAGLGVADRGRRARVGHRDDEVGLDRMLAGEPAADGSTREHE